MTTTYYHNTDRWHGGDEAQIVVPMEQPPEGYVYSSYFASSAIFRKRGCKMLSKGLPVRVGTRVGIREPWDGETCKYCGRDFRLVWSIPDLCWLKLPIMYHNRCLCLECAIYLIGDLKWGDVTITGIARENIYWYTATAVNVFRIRDLPESLKDELPAETLAFEKDMWVEVVTMRREINEPLDVGKYLSALDALKEVERLTARLTTAENVIYNMASFITEYSCENCSHVVPCSDCLVDPSDSEKTATNFGWTKEDADASGD